MNYSLNGHLLRCQPLLRIGFPHTHKDTVFLSENTINESDDRLLFVLIHEQMHVMQRKKPELFKILYTKYYPFKTGKLKVQDKYISRIRSNPDMNIYLIMITF